MSAVTTRIVLVGVGNAGVGVLDRIAVEHPSLKGLMVINNDPDSLAASVVEERLLFPNSEAVDFPDGFLAIEEQFAIAIRGANSVILCGGLGGELGSFLLPALAARAKADGITTLASVGIPFSFEGRRRRELATTSLRTLHDLCDGVAVVDNDRLSGGVPSTTAVGEAFLAADRALQSSLLALRGMLSTSGPVKITRADLSSVLKTAGGTTLFGHGSAEGGNRLHEALENALKSPLLSIAGKGSALKEVSTLLLLISGPADISFAEVERAVIEMERVVGEGCQIKVGVHAQESAGAMLKVFIFASSGTPPRPEKVSANPPVSRVPERKIESHSDASKLTLPTKALKNVHTTKGANTTQQTQGVLDLGSYQRGRFDKSEPTIVAGEDLDIPTFLRKGIKLTFPSKR
jgi:cell division protein FtsZ